MDPDAPPPSSVASRAPLDPPPPAEPAPAPAPAAPAEPEDTLGAGIGLALIWGALPCGLGWAVQLSAKGSAVALVACCAVGIAGWVQAFREAQKLGTQAVSGVAIGLVACGLALLAAALLSTNPLSMA
jgi:hypothetical protein